MAVTTEEAYEMNRIFIVNDSGQILDAFILERYQTGGRFAVEALADDVQAAVGNTPTDWRLRPGMADEVAKALEAALAGAGPAAARQIRSALHKVNSLDSYTSLPADERLDRLIEEMVLIAGLTEEIEELADRAKVAVERVRASGLNYPELDALWELVKDDDELPAHLPPVKSPARRI